MTRKEIRFLPRHPRSTYAFVPWIASFFATRRLSVSGTRRSAKPAMNDQIMRSANEAPSLGPVLVRKSLSCKTPAFCVSLGVDVGDGLTAGVACAFASAAGGV